jgi:hypothetical protein
MARISAVAHSLGFVDGHLETAVPVRGVPALQARANQGDLPERLSAGRAANTYKRSMARRCRVKLEEPKRPLRQTEPMLLLKSGSA